MATAIMLVLCALSIKVNHTHSSTSIPDTASIARPDSKLEKRRIDKHLFVQFSKALRETQPSKAPRHGCGFPSRQLYKRAANIKQNIPTLVHGFAEDPLNPRPAPHEIITQLESRNAQTRALLAVVTLQPALSRLANFSKNCTFEDLAACFSENLRSLVLTSATGQDL